MELTLDWQVYRIGYKEETFENDKIKVVSLEVSDTLAKGHAINNLEIISGSEICIVKKINGSR